ncbi:terminase%2C superantigen-encoding pathogenicity islands SaPI [Staphylococcus schweitzeri]|uniref:Terminase, superantigen-encoding pathogenicity islands SaPI n=1 Tax=Staphylococcus schweitzeri TaxID=1654388 RepID=A0A077ULR4_9STAP|nr:terminase%2C superantigen-encoding pathogenicity islands SaPI [Staphylococcus schweitzeri]
MRFPAFFGVLTNAEVGDETETKEVVVKRGEYKENPQSN